MSSVHIIPISDEQLDLGNRIHWDPTTQSLYYVDVLNSTVHRHDVRTRQNLKAKVGEY